VIKVHHKYGLLIFFVFLFFDGFSQEESKPFGIKETIHFGSILPHRPIVNEVIEGHSLAYEFSFYKSTIGKKDWEQLYNYPQIGISTLIIDLGNKDELGMGLGIFPFIEIPLNKRKINWRLKVGYGLGLIEKPFDRVTNYKNIVIGSKYNALIYANMLWSVKLGKSISTSSGISLIHFSNGSFERPNLGINVFSLNTGLSYHFGKSQKYVSTNIDDRKQEWTKKVMVGFGLKEIPPVDGSKYFVSSYSFNMIKARSNKSSFGFGTDLFYNTSLSNLILVDTNNVSSSLDNFRLGIVGIYSFDFGKISFLAEMGVYAFTKHKKQGLIYHRLRTRFNVSDKLFINLGLKTHYAVADFVECGVGFNL